MNQEVRHAAREKGVRHWQIAKRLGIGENTLIRKMREQLSPEDEKRILTAIDEIAAERARG